MEEEDWIVYPDGAIFRPYYGRESRLNVRRVRVAPDVAAIPYQFFKACSKLEEVDLANVASIGELAFAGCRNLRHVDLSNVSSIGDRAFFQSPGADPRTAGLRTVSIPSSVTRIGDEAFANCYQLADVALSEGIQTIGVDTFVRCRLTSIVIPSSVRVIGRGAFKSCAYMESIELPEGVQTIGERAFACSGLRNVSIPSTVVEIGDYAFEGCTELESIELPEGVQTIGERAFGHRGEITIPSPAFVISAGDLEDTLECQLSRDEVVASSDWWNVRMVASKLLKDIPEGRLTEAGRRINQILDREQSVEERLAQVHELFADFELATQLRRTVQSCTSDLGVEERSRKRARVDDFSMPGDASDLGVQVLPIVASFLW